MVSGEAAIASAWGMHARLAYRFVRLAEEFKSTVTVRTPSASADGREIMELLMLGAGPGDPVTVETAGADERQALDVLINFLRNDSRVL